MCAVAHFQLLRLVTSDMRADQRIYGIKIGKAIFCCHQLAIELTADLVFMGRKKERERYVAEKDKEEIRDMEREKKGE